MLAFLCRKNSIPQMAKVMLEMGMGLSAMSGCESFVLIMATPPPLTERIIVRNFLSNCWAKAILRSALAAQSTKLQSRHAPKWNVVVGIFLGNTFRFFHVPLVGSSPKPGSNNPPPFANFQSLGNIFCSFTMPKMLSACSWCCCCWRLPLALHSPPCTLLIRSVGHAEIRMLRK